MEIRPPIQHHIQRNPDAMSVKGSWRTNGKCMKNNSCYKSIKCVKQETTKMKMLRFGLRQTKIINKLKVILTPAHKINFCCCKKTVINNCLVWHRMSHMKPHQFQNQYGLFIMSATVLHIKDWLNSFVGRMCFSKFCHWFPIPPSDCCCHPQITKLAEAGNAKHGKLITYKCIRTEANILLSV